MGPVAGEKLTSLILDRATCGTPPSTGRRSRSTAHLSRYPVRCLPGGLRCTVLSPGPEQLLRLRKAWVPVVTEAGLDPAVPAPEPRPVAAGFERMGGLDE